MPPIPVSSKRPRIIARVTDTVISGINFIFYYGTQYFKNAGFTNPFIISMITSTINVVSTLPGLYAYDLWGRRPLLLWGAIGMCISQLLVAALGTSTTSQDHLGNIIVHNVAAQKAGIAFVCLYIFFFASTWGPLAWVVTGKYCLHMQSLVEFATDAYHAQANSSLSSTALEVCL